MPRMAYQLQNNIIIYLIIAGILMNNLNSKGKSHV